MPNQYPEIFDLEARNISEQKGMDFAMRVTGSQGGFGLCGGGAPCFSIILIFMNQNGITLWIDTPYDVLSGQTKGRKRTSAPVKRSDR